MSNFVDGWQRYRGGDDLWDNGPAGQILTGEALPVQALSGSLAATLGGLGLTAAGTVGATGITATVSATLGALTSVSAASARVAGSVSATLGTLTAASQGAVAASGAVVATLGPVTLTGAAVAPVAGALTATLEPLYTSAFTFLDPRPDGIAINHVGPLVITETPAGLVIEGTNATVLVQGNAANTLGALTLSASGTVAAPGAVTGALSATLDALTVQASGSVQGGEPPPPQAPQGRPPFAIIGKPEDGKSLRKLRLEQQKAEDAILEKAIVALALELV